MDRRRFIQVGALAGVGMTMPWAALRWAPRAQAAGTVQAAQLPGNKIPRFVDPLPVLKIPDMTFNLQNEAIDAIVAGADEIQLSMVEFKANVMPSTFKPAAGAYAGTWVWGYRQGDLMPGNVANAETYTGPVIVATRGTGKDTPTKIRFINRLGDTTNSNLTAWVASTDQTLHWANPTNDMTMPMPMAQYAGPIPAVPHLHGGEVPPQLDGGPDAWFLSDPATWSKPSWDGGGVTYSQTGQGYYTRDSLADPTYQAVYTYPNTQEASNIWFHDHTLGATRLNVYAGLAGAYIVTEAGVGLSPVDANLPLIPLVIQDRMFDVNGQLFFPNVGINPMIHPFWVPEFVGDTMCVNGKVWPYFRVDRKRYRFLILEGSNARAYDLDLVDPVTRVRGPRMWVIGTDGGYLEKPALIDPVGTGITPKSLVTLPGERYEVIVDFNDSGWLARITAAYAALGRALPPTLNLTLANKAPAPFPRGTSSQTSTVGAVMQFRVNTAPPATVDQSYDPAVGAALRPPIIRLVNQTTGTAIATPTVTRQLTLNEVMGMGGPVEVLVNNTRYDGKSVAMDVFPSVGVRTDFVLGPIGDTYYSEMPKEGDTELWEIVNLTADAHPIHLHLVQFQLMNRQVFDAKGYQAAYNAILPGSAALDPMTGLAHPPGVFIGGFGPPADYNTGRRLAKALDGTWGFTGPVVAKQLGGGKVALGGNPSVDPFLNPKKWPIRPPLNYEAGWKDTIIAYPGEVTRIMVRWLPTSSPGASVPFAFSPGGPHGYVWHCHIVDHEDNEMMRPDLVQPLTVTRTLVGSADGGSDY